MTERFKENTNDSTVTRREGKVLMAVMMDQMTKTPPCTASLA